MLGVGRNFSSNMSKSLLIKSPAELNQTTQRARVGLG
jgi:hypothetical protein